MATSDNWLSRLEEHFKTIDHWWSEDPAGKNPEADTHPRTIIRNLMSNVRRRFKEKGVKDTSKFINDAMDFQVSTELSRIEKKLFQPELSGSLGSPNYFHTEMAERMKFWQWLARQLPANEIVHKVLADRLEIFHNKLRHHGDSDRPQYHGLELAPVRTFISETDAILLYCEQHLAKFRKLEPVTAELKNDDWSRPMSQSEMRARLNNLSPRKFKTFVKNHPLNPAGNRQLWQIYLGNMDKKTRDKIEKN